MTHYDAGRRFEWAVRDDLRADGYDVIRSAGSKSKVDLVAVKPGELLFIQCKRDGKCGPAERTELIKLAIMASALPIVACKARVGIGYWHLNGYGPKDRKPWSAARVEIEEIP